MAEVNDGTLDESSWEDDGADAQAEYSAALARADRARAERLLKIKRGETPYDPLEPMKWHSIDDIDPDDDLDLLGDRAPDETTEEAKDSVLAPQESRESLKRELHVIKIVKAHVLEKDTTKSLALVDMLMDEWDAEELIDGFLDLFWSVLTEIEFLERPLKPRTVLNRLAREAKTKLDELNELR